ncbi:DNA polymerase-1 [Jatrophihabitans sp. GAS493]|uniref:5'-3' exonuclease n=1 Tax=Jatrophihabitans sp. GAS493 TaxID=1907575 RepID=UPI000BB91DAC|nr:5'-3' exonuclease H3TH domain-containing protein [Jatrophihabitans sp. GAS493]SOD73151.1 DNA polymerase-1 [Jatrophihabitans sp. GAS493]
MSSQVLLAVDGNSLLHRSYHALASSGLRTSDGRAMWAVRGLVSQLVAAVERIEPDAVVIGFDDPQASLRRDRWPQYKAQRSEKPPTLEQQLMLAVELLSGMGIEVIVPPGLEADDVLASAARHATAAAAHTVVMTSDRDSFALINETTSVLRIINGGVEASPMLNAQRLMLLLGITPAQYRDYAAMRGDASDNLVGVHGIGAKTAAKLLTALGTARNAFDDLDAGGSRVIAAIGKAAAARLGTPEARAAWELNCAVMAMHTSVPLEVDLAQGCGAGRGRLPLAADSLRPAFETLQLTWTLPKALRLLAGEQGESAPVPVPAYTSYDGAFATDRGERFVRDAGRRDPGYRSGSGFRKPFAPLHRKTANSDQLSLF